jgi:hypothetical protein
VKHEVVGRNNGSEEGGGEDNLGLHLEGCEV